MGKGTYQARKRLRQAFNRRWCAEEDAVVSAAVADGHTLPEVQAMLPHRSADSVKDRFYRAKQPQDRDEPASLNDARRQKDAREGSEKLLQALIRAGFVSAQGRVA
jgi:hypothetical protein